MVDSAEKFKHIDKWSAVDSCPPKATRSGEIRVGDEVEMDEHRGRKKKVVSILTGTGTEYTPTAGYGYVYFRILFEDGSEVVRSYFPG